VLRPADRQPLPRRGPRLSYAQAASPVTCVPREPALGLPLPHPLLEGGGEMRGGDPTAGDPAALRGPGHSGGA
jgi:hypothetical protein